MGEQKGLQDELQQRLHDQLQRQATLEEELISPRREEMVMVKQSDLLTQAPPNQEVSSNVNECVDM